MNSLRVRLGVMGLVLGLTYPAGVQARPCAQDAEKFCKDVQPGGGRIIQCLKQHEAELSSDCKAQMAQGKEDRHEMKDACSADREKFCKDVKPGGGRLRDCMKAHKDELSSACKEEWKKMREDRKGNGGGAPPAAVPEPANEK